VGTEHLQAAIEQLEAAIVVVREQLAGMEAVLERVRGHLSARAPLASMYTDTGWAGEREAAIAALSALSSALRHSRAEYIRALVDDEGLRIAEVARIVGQPRQLVKRHYDGARNRSDW
jgi:hypothetical protein